MPDVGGRLPAQHLEPAVKVRVLSRVALVGAVIVLNPLPDAANEILHAFRRRAIGKGPDIFQFGFGSRLVRKVRPRRIEFVAPGILKAVLAARRAFPFLFHRQALARPVAIIGGIEPGHPGDRPVVLPLGIGAAFPMGRLEIIDGLDESGVAAVGDLVPVDVKPFAEESLLRSFVFVKRTRQPHLQRPPRVLAVGAENKRSRRDVHHVLFQRRVGQAGGVHPVVVFSLVGQDGQRQHNRKQRPQQDSTEGKLHQHSILSPGGAAGVHCDFRRFSKYCRVSGAVQFSAPLRTPMILPSGSIR